MRHANRIASELAIVLAVVAILACAPLHHSRYGDLPPGIELRTEDVFYDVTGTDAAEIAAAIDRNGPKDEQGRPFTGELSWTVSWRFMYQPTAAGCAITRPHLVIHTTTLMPQWNPPPGTDEQLVREWTALLEIMLMHEDAHGKIAIEGAGQALNWLRRNCGNSNSSADSALRVIIDRYQGRNRQYDLDTRHGLAQGTFWPNPPVARWSGSPSVTIIGGEPSDARVPQIRAAVGHWNGILADLDAPFRLGEPTHVAQAVPESYLAVLAAGRDTLLPAVLRDGQREILVFLSEQRFVSLYKGSLPGEVLVIAVGDPARGPLAQPNVAQNVIAHQLGHAIGLGHNLERDKLMCEPASCDPSHYRSEATRFFPLTATERDVILERYPPPSR